jgi:hypothetical protein
MRERHGDRMRLELTAHPLDHRLDELRHRIDIEVGNELAGLDAAHAEEIANEPVEALSLHVDGACGIAPFLVRHRDRGIGDAARGRANRCQRRPEVMRDRVEERRAQLLAPSRHFGISGGIHEPIAADGLRDLVSGGGQQPGGLQLRLPQPRVALAPE